MTKAGEGGSHVESFAVGNSARVRLIKPRGKCGWCFAQAAREDLFWKNNTTQHPVHECRCAGLRIRIATGPLTDTKPYGCTNHWERNEQHKQNTIVLSLHLQTMRIIGINALSAATIHPLLHCPRNRFLKFGRNSWGRSEVNHSCISNQHSATGLTDGPHTPRARTHARTHAHTQTPAKGRKMGLWHTRTHNHTNEMGTVPSKPWKGHRKRRKTYTHKSCHA